MVFKFGLRSALQMPKARRNWTEPEILDAIQLYIRTPFGRMHSSNPDVIQLANKIGRTPGSIALKLTNIASLDETLDRRGMANASKLDRELWSRFFDEISETAKKLPSSDTQTFTANAFEAKPQSEYQATAVTGKNIQRLTSVRQGQALFRSMVLANYDFKCAVTGIAQTELLIAGHIVPWATDKDNRMNPRNGICLNRLHDRAFEAGLIAINDDGKILYSSKLDRPTKQKMESLNDNGYIRFPSKFRPDPSLLEIHRSRFVA
ncbi:MAG: HNH endonuclease [Nitratireductor sp.]